MLTGLRSAARLRELKTEESAAPAAMAAAPVSMLRRVPVNGFAMISAPFADRQTVQIWPKMTLEEEKERRSTRSAGCATRAPHQASGGRVLLGSIEFRDR